MIANNIINIDQPKNDDLLYYRESGAFFIHNAGTHQCDGLETCRESFAEIFKSRVHWIGYTACVASIERINNFFETVSDRLHLAPQDRITFYRTTRERVIILQVPHWWRCSILRREVLTLMLRTAASHFSTGTLNEAFNHYSLTRDENVRFAINRFMNGHTVLRNCRLFDYVNYERIGFCDTMNHLTKEQIRANMVLPVNN